MRKQNFIRQIVQDMAEDEEIPHLQYPEDFELEDGSMIQIISPSPEPSEELELTPSPDLNELSTPVPPDELQSTPSPVMISPDMYLKLPEPPENIKILGIDMSSPEPALYIEFPTKTTQSKAKIPESPQVKFNTDCNEVVDTDIGVETSGMKKLKLEGVHQQINIPLQAEDQSKPNFELCEGKPNPSETNKIISKQNKQNEESNLVPKRNTTISSEIQDSEPKIIQHNDPKAAETRKSSVDNSTNHKLYKRTPDLSRTKRKNSNRKKLVSNIYKKHRKTKKKLAITSKPMETEISDEDTESDAGKQPDYSVFQTLGPEQVSPIQKQESLILESKTVNCLPGSVELLNDNENNNLKLLANTCDNDLQLCMADKNINSSRAKEADGSYLENTESHENLAFGHQRAKESVSPEYGVRATDHIKHRHYKKTQSTKTKNKYVEANTSDSEDRPAAKHLYKCSTRETELSESTPGIMTPLKYKRFNLVHMYSKVSKKNKPMTLSRDEIASTSKGKKAESSENSKSGDQEMNEKQIDNLELSELNEGTPEPIEPPKTSRPIRMTLLPIENKQKDLIQKAASSDLDEFELDDVVRKLNYFGDRETKKQNRAELSQSSELSEGSPEPIDDPPQRNKTSRIQLSQSEDKRRSGTRLLSTEQRLDKTNLLHSQNLPIYEWRGRRDSDSLSVPSTSGTAQSHTSPKLEPTSSSDSRTRVLVTPDRSESLGFPTKRVHTPDRKSKKGTSKKYLRKFAKKRKWVESVRRHKERPKSDSSAVETTSSNSDDSTDSGNIGDCSGVGDDDDNGDI